MRFRWVLCVGLLSACAPSEEEIKAEFADFVDSRKACATNEDCVVAWTGCPLGCGTAVNRRHQEAVEQKARELVEDYESGGASCVYDCTVVAAVCLEDRCTEAVE
jgi:hypothetical protein